MRILIINPNSNQGVRQLLEQSARLSARSQDTLISVCAPSGIDLIISEDDQQKAGFAVAECARQYIGKVDGIVIGSFGDTGIELVRSSIDVPVVGIAEAAMGAAIYQGPTPAIISFSESMRPSFIVMLKKHGFSEDDIDVHLLPTQPLPDPGLISRTFQSELIALARIAQKAKASCIIPGGAPLAGFAKTICTDFNVPLIDGTQEAVRKLIEI